MEHNATIYTNKWPIRLMLHAQKVPHTVANFVTLAKEWFYDGLSFHRVIDNFMIQTWCPVWNGTGGPWYAFGDEFHHELRHTWPGTLSMANSWPHSNGSQFFITHIDTPRLDGKHAVFWYVVDQDDQDIVNAIIQWDIIDRIEIHEETFHIPEEVNAFIEQIQTALAQRK